MSVRAVVFDVGNVLVEWDPNHLYRALIPNARQRAVFLRDVVTQSWHFQHDAGRPFAETSAELIARYPGHRALIEAWGPRFNETLPYLIPGMADVVCDLAAKRVPLFAITNFSGEFWKPFAEREAALFAPFSNILVSGDEKLVKPDSAIYQLALRRFGLSDGEAVFVDDRHENVEAAERNGFVGHVFTNAAVLRADFVERGLL